MWRRNITTATNRWGGGGGCIWEDIWRRYNGRRHAASNWRGQQQLFINMGRTGRREEGDVSMGGPCGLEETWEEEHNAIIIICLELLLASIPNISCAMLDRWVC